MSDRIPSAVARQNEAANQLVASLLNGSTEPAPVPAIPAPPAPVPPPQPQPTPQPATPANNVTLADEVARWKTEAEKNEARFKTLQGKYNAEVPALHAKLRELSEAIDKLKAAPQVAAPPAPTTPLFDDATRTDMLGEDRANAIEQAIQEGVRRQLQALGLDVLPGQVKPLIEAAPQVQANAQQAYLQAIRQQVATGMPYFEQVDQDPRFEAWLNDADELSGQPRIGFFQTALNGGDVQRLKTFYNAFARTLGISTTTNPAPVGAASPVAPGNGAPSSIGVDTVSLAEYGRVTSEYSRARSNPANYPQGHANELAMKIAAWDRLIAVGKITP